MIRETLSRVDPRNISSSTAAGNRVDHRTYHYIGHEHNTTAAVGFARMGKSVRAAELQRYKLRDGVTGSDRKNDPHQHAQTCTSDLRGSGK